MCGTIVVAVSRVPPWNKGTVSRFYRSIIHRISSRNQSFLLETRARNEVSGSVVPGYEKYFLTVSFFFYFKFRKFRNEYSMAQFANTFYK